MQVFTIMIAVFFSLKVPMSCSLFHEVIQEHCSTSRAIHSHADGVTRLRVEVEEVEVSVSTARALLRLDDLRVSWGVLLQRELIGGAFDAFDQGVELKLGVVRDTLDAELLLEQLEAAGVHGCPDSLTPSTL